MVPAVLALALAALAIQDGAEEVTRAHADGVVERWHEVARDGERVRHGGYRRTHPDGTTLALEGDYGDGTRRGVWKSFHPSGARESSGRYRRDERDGEWVFWHDAPGGEKRAEGTYEDGLRTGWWSFWHPDGSRDEANTGYYRGIDVTRGRRFTVEYRHAERGAVELRHGRFRSFWEDGSPQMVGEFHDGERHGTWRFWHRNGMLDPELVSGVYEHGRKVRALAVLRTSDLPAPETIAALATPQPPAWCEVDPGLAARIAAFPGEELPAGALVPGPGTVSVVLRELLRLDLEDAGQRARAARLHGALLVPAAHGNGLLWLPGDSAEERARDRLTLMRWHALFELTRDDPVFWEVELPNARAWEEAGPGIAVLANPPPPRLFAPRLEGPAERWAPRFSSNKRRYGETRDRREAIDAGLGWLAEHAATDGAARGSWQSDRFETRCAAEGHALCGGAGIGAATTGVTGLALLAFLGDGNTPFEGRHAAEVRGGLRWLLSEQDLASGRLGEVRMREFLYGHAIATEALCEALAFCESGLLRRAASRAVAFLLSGQNPGGGWRYDVPAAGESDTSITGWATLALLAARDAGIPVEDRALDGARTWFHVMTDDGTGRTGYTDRGSASARVAGLNEHVPRTISEPLTSIAITCRLRLGDDPADVPLLTKGAGLVLGRLPAWAPDGVGTDMIAWYFGTQAMFELGAHRRELWTAWEPTLESVMRRGQTRTGAAAGSWDPIGLWASFGGRIYATALATLSLETPTRSARALD